MSAGAEELMVVRTRLAEHLASLPAPTSQRESGRIDGLLEAGDFLTYRWMIDTGKVPPDVSFAEWRAPDSNWRRD